MPLFDYMEQTQRFLHDTNQDLLDPGNIISYINRARRQVAMQAQCIRRLTPISGQVVSAKVTAGGAGYSSNPTVTISAPDFPSGRLPKPAGDQATAAAIVQNGVITGAYITYGGQGYYQPTAKVTDATGTGATVTLALSFINQLAQSQEVYPFTSVDLTQFPGVSAIYYVRSVAVLFSNFRYVLACPAFTSYQALIRTYPFQYQYTPFFVAQFGQGVDGSFFMYPLPSQAYQMEWDCQCLPQDLITDQSVEAIPQPWSEAIPYFAAHLAYLEIQNANMARMYLDLFDNMMGRYSRYARPGKASNVYGRIPW